MQDRANHLRDRISDARWTLDRNISWIAAAEVKVGVIVAVDTALLGGLASAFNVSDATARNACSYTFVALTTIIVVLALIFAAMAVIPKTAGPKESFVFFGPIAKKSVLDFSGAFQSASDEDVLVDLLRQIHRNAQIALQKYTWVRRSLIASFVSSVPWMIAISLLIKY